MWWLWGSIGVVLAVVFIGAYFHDRRHKGDAQFGGDLETARHVQDAENQQRLWGGGVGGGGVSDSSWRVSQSAVQFLP